MSRVARNLNDNFKTLPAALQFPFAGLKLVFVSDLHRGIGDRADDFVASAAAYDAALEHYFDNGFSLFLVGDGEELWEVKPSKWKRIFATHSNSIEWEKRFFREGRYHRIFGNHDMPYMKKKTVERVLHPHFPGLEVPQAMTLEILDGDAVLGKILLFHGHQGDFVADDLAELSEVAVREVWARLQRLLRLRSTDYSAVRRIRGNQNEAVYYDWSVEQKGLVSIMGHTHRMAFEEIDGLAHRNRVRKRIAKYDLRFRRLTHSESRHNYRMMRDTWKKRLARAEFADTDGTLRMKPCYFNTGCVCFEDGEATCLEASGGFLRLVRWQDGLRTELARARLREIFRQVGVADG